MYILLRASGFALNAASQPLSGSALSGRRGAAHVRAGAEEAAHPALARLVLGLRALAEARVAGGLDRRVVPTRLRLL